MTQGIIGKMLSYWIRKAYFLHAAIIVIPMIIFEPLSIGSIFEPQR